MIHYAYDDPFFFENDSELFPEKIHLIPDHAHLSLTSG